MKRQRIPVNLTVEQITALRKLGVIQYDIRQCQKCGERFVPGDNRQVYCSSRCASRERQQRFWRRHDI